MAKFFRRILLEDDRAVSEEEKNADRKIKSTRTAIIISVDTKGISIIATFLCCTYYKEITWFGQIDCLKLYIKKHCYYFIAVLYF